MTVASNDFDQLVKGYYPRIYSFALKLTRNPQDAADITQDTFVRAYRARAKRLLDRSPDSWLLRIAHRCFLDSRRTKRRRPVTVSVEDLHTDRFEFDPADHSPNPEETLHGKTFSLPMAAALAALSPDHRQLLYLAHFEELSHKELSLILGCGATTVKTRIHRAHVALKLQLGRGGLRNAVECRVGPSR